MRITALAGGVGAARFLRGLVRALDDLGAQLTVIGNTADDLVLHGLHISPDLDTLAYTLGKDGGGVHEQQGWGRADERFVVAEELQERYGAEGWFTLGDRDLATHLVRTEVLHAGGTLSQATARIAAAWGLPLRLLPMSDDPVATRVHTVDGRTLGFQQWWVRERAEPAVAGVELAGADTAVPAPGVLEAIRDADVVLLCPSNPVVSIGPILALPGVREALTGPPVVGVSPIVGGAVVRGMADRLLPAVGVEVSAAAVACLYRRPHTRPDGVLPGFLDGWVLDTADAALADELRAEGLAVAVTDTVFTTPAVAEAVARTALRLAGTPSGPRP